MTEPGRHERRGRHENRVDYEVVMRDAEGRVCYEGPEIRTIEVLCTACGRPWGGAHAESCPLWSAWTTEDDRGRRIRGLLP